MDFFQTVDWPLEEEEEMLMEALLLQFWFSDTSLF